MADFRALSPAEAKEFLNAKGKRRAGVHVMTKKICHWSYCARCGLVALKNETTRRALRQPCVVEED